MGEADAGRLDEVRPRGQRLIDKISTPFQRLPPFSGSRISMSPLRIQLDVTGNRFFKMAASKLESPSSISDFWLHRTDTARCNQMSEIQDGGG